MCNLHSKVLGNDIPTLLPPKIMGFPACIFTRQAKYGIQKKNDYLKFYLANFFSRKEKCSLPATTNVYTLNKWIDMQERCYETYATGQLNIVHFHSPRNQ